MSLHKLPKITTKEKRRIGRGYGSGRGKTSGRGTKGQKARGKVKLGFEGGQLPFIRRLPYKKGFKHLGKKPLIFNVAHFNFMADGQEITLENLVSLGLVPENWKHGVKILGDGQLTKKIIIKGIPCSKGANIKIKAAGGEIKTA